MELKIIDGRYQIDDSRGLVEVENINELMQRVKMKLLVRRGSFIPLPDYGSRLHLLGQVKRSERQSAARHYVLEALSDENELELTSLEISEGSDREVKIGLSFTYKGEYAVDLDMQI